jgi:hypothetical protein
MLGRGGVDDSSGPAAALRASVLQVQHTDGDLDGFLLWLMFVATDLGCDIFLSLRLLVVAQLTMACIMFVVLNHGVINVIFSILAVAFGMEIDCKFMEMLTNFGFEQSPLYILKVKPALSAIMNADHRELASNRRGSQTRRQTSAGMVRIGHMFQMRNFWGLEASKWWAFILTSALLAHHQFWSLSIAINSGPSVLVSQLQSVFQEFVGYPQVLLLMMVACYGAAFFNTICYHGLHALPALAQLGLCGLWVYSVMRNFLLLGVLAWYSDVVHTRSFIEQFLDAMSQDALFIYPALGLHLFLALLRPGLLIVFCTVAPAETGKALTMKPVPPSSLAQ